MKKNRVSFLVVFLSLIVFCSNVFALECTELELSKYVDQADYVFIGEVKSVKKEENSQVEISDKSELGVNSNSKSTINVIDVYKGNVDGLVDVISSNYWGEEFVEGKEYLVFANNKDELMVVSICSGTVQTQYAKEKILKLEASLNP